MKKGAGKRKVWILIVVVVAVSALSFVYFRLLIWTPFCCTHEDVDIISGRTRYTRYLLYCKISERVEDSVLTTALSPESLAGAQPDWHRVNTFSPGVRYSPHYLYHSAIGQIGTIGKVWEVAQFEDEAKREVAETILQLWQSDGRDSGAGRYIDNVGDIAFEAANSESRISAADLPVAATNRP